ncbi:LuxR C-terminal-related transcriptional regulator [Enterococcus sp. DIV0086]|uniref:helix-turn-helix transcriptional regulator n=1 Tax=Enterococcus sp. DIV0086 TaxID=2774655 RepID=UPI003D275A2B
MKKHLSTNRVKAPEILEKFISREELAGKIQIGLQKKLMILEAGAGHGKTTAIREKLSYLPSDRWHWLTLNEDCDHLIVFWSYMIETLKGRLDSTKEELLVYFQSGMNSENIEEFIIFLVNSLAIETDEYLVLDDFHTVKNEVVLHSFERFLEELPDSLHVVITTRYQPELYLTKFLLAEQLQYIREDDFLLSDNEGTTFIQQNSREELSQEAKNYLLETAMGWIGGLKLLMAVKKINQPHVEKISFENKILSEYLAREIFDNLSKEEQEFLVISGFFPFVYPNVSREIFPKVNFLSMIEGLLEKNLMITCIDNVEQKFTFHPILKEYLVKEFQTLPVEQQQNLRKQTAAVFIEDGYLDEGISLLFELGEYPQLMNLIVENQQSFRRMYYIEQIPKEITLTNIDFAFQKFVYYYSNLDYDNCYDLIEALEEKYPDKKEIRALSGIKLLLGSDYLTTDQTPNTIQEINQLKLDDVSKALIFLKSAVILFFKESYQQAKQFIEASEKLNQKSKSNFLSYFNQTLLAQICEETGELNKSLAILTTVYQSLDSLGINSKMKETYQVSFFITITGIHLKQLNLAAAADTLKRADTNKHPHIRASYLYNLAEFHYLASDEEKGWQIFKELETGTTNSYNNPFTQSGIMKYALKIDQLPGYYEEQFIEVYKQHPELHNMAYQLFYGMILLKRRDYQGCIYVTDRILEKSRKQRIYAKIIEANLLKLSALLQIKGDNSRQLLNIYHECLYYGSENQILNNFFLFRQEIAQLIELLKDKIDANLEPREKDFHNEIMNLCCIRSGSLLTEREIEILGEMAKGMTNRAISEKLFISVATVKTHILNIYRKLEVNSRVTAVDKAKQMRLI